MSPLKVLYVDDDADIREVAELCLQMDEDLEVRIAASGPEALALLESWRADIVMLDVMMPQMDGPMLLAEIRARDGVQPAALFITARVLPDELAQLMALGVAGVITKPFDPIGLAAEVRRLAAL